MFYDRIRIFSKNRLLAKLLFASSVFLCLNGNASAGLQINKSVDPISPSPAAENDNVRYNISVTNTGPGNLNNVIINDSPVNLNGLSFTQTSSNPSGSNLSGNRYRFGNLSDGETVTLRLDANVNSAGGCPVIQNSASVTENSGTFSDSDSAANIEYDFEFTSGSTSNVIQHLPSSFCEFCDTGIVRIRITNPTTAALQNITLVENLQALGLNYINNSTTSSIGSASNPNISGGGTILTWTDAQIPALANLAAGNSIDITFEVSTYGEAEILADASRNIIATASFDMSCLSGTQSVNTGQFELPIRQPEPRLFKDASNFDASQGNSWRRTVYASRNDDIIWRVRTQNLGDANMEAQRINDSINGNFSINFICPSSGDANAIAANNGVDPGGTGCIAMTPTLDVADPFGNIADPDDVADNSTDAVYYVGRVLNTHQDRTNSADISWGCAATSPTGGLITDPANTNGSNPSGIRVSRTAFLNTNVDPNDLQITQTVTGSNTAQPLGTKGLMTITLRNQTGGSVQNLRVRATLPAGYVMDNSYGPGDGQSAGQAGYGQPTFTNTGAFGNYPGFIDTITRDDPELATADPLDDLNPTFTLTSSTTGADFVQQVDMFRHDDVITITFGIIMVNPAYFDLVADIDLDEEIAADGTDPNSALALSNNVFVDFDAVDSTGVQGQTRNETFNYNSDPEDLDVSISDSLFILTNDINVPLDLNVDLTNNGGHDANDHTTYVSFGQAMTVQTPASGCSLTSNPPPHPHWNQPTTIPTTATVYACDRGTLAPGATTRFTFSVIKNTLPTADDDLTFRADVIGEITRFASTTTPLTDPAPASVANTTPNLQLANNYTLDVIRSRVLGFNLTKSVWYCAESGSPEPPPLPLPPTPGDLNTQIGEDCNYHIESGGWFGFITPGYQLIEVNDVVVTDDLPDGQGFIAFDNVVPSVNPFNFNNTANIAMIDSVGGAGTTPLDETDIQWRFNTVGNGIQIKDEFFRVDLKTRFLNDPVDTSAAPNIQAAQSRNIAKTSFNALFQSDPINGVTPSPLNIPVSETLNVPGYPLEPVRRVDMTVTEPSISVVKEVCNETLYGVGTGCSNFTTLANDGDTNDFYIYRITLSNEASSGGVQRAPAFNIISIDNLDLLDQVLVVDFASDGLDNDGDGLIDAADINGEGSISDNIINNGTPAQITFDSTHSNALLRVNPGSSVTFYYRVDPDDSVSPLQILTNTVNMSYDTLDGDFGNQNQPQLDNAGLPTSGRARIYNTTPAQAQVQMIPLLAQPKVVVETSNTPLVPGPSHNVSVGEEVRYLLVSELPVANLRQFKIRDELPAGIRCVEGQVVNLDAPPYAAAGFVPGGVITSTCTSTGSNDFVEWNFGDQQVTLATGTRFNFPISFIARVENSALTNEGVVITNGGGTVDPITCTGGVGVCYVNEAGTAVGLEFAPVDIVVREPVIALTKSFAPAVNSDAGDVLTVTVTATNNGTAAAYNLRVLDDLVGSDMTFIPGSLSGTDPPDNADITTIGANQPIFSWNSTNPDYEITPSSVKTFTFDVRVDTTAQPLEILDNTIQAEWSSLPGQSTAIFHSTAPPGIGPDGTILGLRNGAIPNVADAINDYETTATDSVSVLPLTMVKTDLDPAVVSTIGAHKNFQIEITLPEGTTNNLVVNDNLNTAGLSYTLADQVPFDIQYEFIGIQSINGSTTLNQAAFNSLPLNNATGNISWNIGTVVTQEENDPTENLINPTIRIKYFARINNDNLSNAGGNLQNSATVEYTNGEDSSTEVLPASTTPVETVVESALVISKAVNNLTGGGGPASVGDVLEFQISLDNTAGTSTAFDANIVDTLPTSIQLDASFTPTVSGVAVTGFNPTPSGAPAGPLIWGRGNADNSLDIPAGQTLVLTYRTIVQPGTPPGLPISNSAFVDWTSLDNSDPASPFERTGAGCPTITAPNDYCDGPAVAAVSTGPASALFKANPADTEISIGEQFSYSILVPATPQGAALFDVQILDDLAASAADMSFVSVTRVAGGQPWTPVNTGTGKNLVIEDITTGIDIPAGDQIEVAVTVVLNNVSPPNDAGLPFANSATYSYNLIDNNNATRTAAPGNTTPDLTIVEPDLELDKRGPAGNVNFDTPIPYQLVVQNVGTGPAYDATIIDRLPDVPDNPAQVGGTCDVAPLNFNARITTVADEATVVRDLIRDTDYTASYTASPACELVITTLTDKARIEAGEKFIIDYDAMLNVGSQSGATLTNIAGVTQWFSQDTAGAGATGQIREYIRTISNGTPSVVDHEDSFTVTVEAPILTVEKTVINLTTGQDPGSDASPGDVLRYSILVSNVGPLSLPDFSITDEVDALAGVEGFFVSGSMTNFNLPAGADNTNTNITGGANNAGLLDVRNLSIDAAGGANDTVLIEFDITLLPVITSATVIQNQAQLNATSVGVIPSDDPAIGGIVDPTETLITSSPAFQVQKSSQDITGDPTLLQAGDTIRYTITVKNIGQENAINTLLTDQVPANTTYVAGSTTMNGTTVADAGAGISPLAAGMLVNAPENTTAGNMRADSDAAADNVATITFDVVVNLSAIDGTVISNQGFITGDGVGSGAFPLQPSDDPNTAAVDDPTIDIVGDVALFDVQKTVAIVVDGGTLGIVDPNDVLRYTITAVNLGGIPVNNTVLTDAVPASSQYVANSTRLNGSAVPDPLPNTSPLVSGIAISSSDLTPPIPAPGTGMLVPGQSAVIEFDVQVDAAATVGTVISNQGFVSSDDLPTEPTDADGIDTNGDQPTDVVVGSAPSLTITKQVFVVGGGAALAGGQLEYVVRVTNTGIVPVNNVVITDDIDLPVSGQKTYQANSALLNGLPAGVSFVGSVLTANYSATYGDLAPSASAELRFRVDLAAGLNIGDTVTNTADVVWNIPPATGSATASIDIGGVPGSANLNGQVWHDIDFSNDVSAGEDMLQGWSVSLYSNNVMLASTQSGANGSFQFSGLAPNLPTGNAYELRYLAPGANANTAALGNTSSAFTNGAQTITGIVAASGASIQNLNLPIQPNGVVYNSVLRNPVAGARLSMVNQTRSNQPVPANCFADPAQADQVTLINGWYKFDLNFSDPLCVPGDEYVIQITPPADDFVGTTSAILPPVNPITGQAQDVINCPGTAADQIPATVLHCENSDSELPQPTSASASAYALKFLFNAAPVTNQIFNNHIPVDPDLSSAVAISKVASVLNVTRSQLVPYTITVSNTLPAPLTDLSIVDNYPAGFKYVSGSSRLDKAEVEPLINGRRLTWNIPSLNVGESKEIKLLLVVGSGAGEGEYVNTAQMFNNLTGGAASGLASATVRVIPDPTFDCTDIIGKVYDDKNMNAYQDQGEKGLPGVQVATARGLRVTTDQHGRFHITCALVPNETRGSNFIMKLDERSLPSGYRVITENPRVQRATRGKMLKFNFGTSLHRVVKLDLADGVFEKGSTELRPQWRSRIEMLITELEKDASILRLTYLGENETESEVDDRLDAIEDIISKRWEELDCCYKLTIEKEVFWRKGNPSDRKGFE